MDSNKINWHIQTVSFWDKLGLLFKPIKIAVHIDTDENRLVRVYYKVRKGRVYMISIETTKLNNDYIYLL